MEKEFGNLVGGEGELKVEFPFFIELEQYI